MGNKWQVAMVGAQRAGGTSRPLVQDELLGKTLGGYRIEGLLGRGNRASVYRASGMGKAVAIRVFDRDLSDDPDFSARFRAQGAIFATLRHPNLLPNSDYDFGEGHAFIVRPYIAGRTLRNLLNGLLPADEVARLLQPIASALDFVHQRGLVHGDLKPGNILFPYDGPTMLIDLGVAQLLPRGNSLLMAATGRYYGTPEYLSPEQAHGLPLDGRTDGYALAIIAYEALTGRVPFRAENAADTPRTVAARHISATPPKPRLLNPALGATVEAALLRALDKDPERRFASCTGFLSALEGDELGGGTATAMPIAQTTITTRMDALEAALPRAVKSAPLTRAVPERPRALLAATEQRPADETDRLVAQHAAELRNITEGYEARLATEAEALREREEAVAALNEELAGARERIDQLTRQVADLEGLLRDRELLVARVRELESGRKRETTGQMRERRDGEATAGVTLTVLEPERFGLPTATTFTLTAGATVGRHPDNVVCLNDSFVSARHARLDRDADGWTVTDLGATNGTFVNGERITGTAPLVNGDLVRFGRIQLTFG